MSYILVTIQLEIERNTLNLYGSLFILDTAELGVPWKYEERL